MRIREVKRILGLPLFREDPLLKTEKRQIQQLENLRMR
jgi:hypothetical protein